MGTGKPKQQKSKHSIPDYFMISSGGKNPSDEYICRHVIWFWPDSLQDRLSITTNIQYPQGTHPLHLHHSPRYDSLSKNVLWVLQDNLWSRNLCSNTKKLPQVPGQGNCAALDIWAIFSTPLLNCLRKAVHGGAFKWCISGDTTRLVGYCFVNDSTIVQI